MESRGRLSWLSNPVSFQKTQVTSFPFVLTQYKYHNMTTDLLVSKGKTSKNHVLSQTKMAATRNISSAPGNMKRISKRSELAKCWTSQLYYNSHLCFWCLQSSSQHPFLFRKLARALVVWWSSCGLASCGRCRYIPCYSLWKVDEKFSSTGSPERRF